MRLDSKELRTGVCSVCGDPVGLSDHTECAKAKKEMFGDSGERKHPVKKWSRKHCEKATAFFTLREE